MSVLDATCLSHLGITVDHLEVAASFYINVLGFTRLYDNVEEDWSRVGLKLDDLVIELFSRHPGAAERTDPFYPGTYGRPKLAFTVRNIDTAYAAAESAGVPILCRVVDTRTSQFFFVTDPDGTLIQLQTFTGGQRLLADVFGGGSR